MPRARKQQMEEYMTKTAPPEVVETLMPKFREWSLVHAASHPVLRHGSRTAWGSKRFIRDTGYLRSLHQVNVTPIITGIQELKQGSFVTMDGEPGLLCVRGAVGLSRAPSSRPRVPDRRGHPRHWLRCHVGAARPYGPRRPQAAGACQEQAGVRDLPRGPWRFGVLQEF